MSGRLAILRASAAHAYTTLGLPESALVALAMAYPAYHILGAVTRSARALSRKTGS